MLCTVADGDHGQRVPNVAAGLGRKLKLDVVAALPHRLHAEQAEGVSEWRESKYGSVKVSKAAVFACRTLSAAAHQLQ